VIPKPAVVITTDMMPELAQLEGRNSPNTRLKSTERRRGMTRAMRARNRVVYSDSFIGTKIQKSMSLRVTAATARIMAPKLLVWCRWCWNCGSRVRKHDHDRNRLHKDAPKGYASQVTGGTGTTALLRASLYREVLMLVVWVTSLTRGKVYPRAMCLGRC
jgi:hypothetical protein